MDGTRASSISGCGSGEHGFVTRSQTRWAGSWRQKRIHGRSLPTGRRRRLLLKNRTNHAQDRERESPAQLQGWLLTSARARRLGPRWLKGGGRQKSAMEDRGTRPRLRVRTKSRGTGSADASRLHVRQERRRRWRPDHRAPPPWPRLAGERGEGRGGVAGVGWDECRGLKALGPGPRGQGTSKEAAPSDVAEQGENGES